MSEEFEKWASDRNWDLAKFRGYYANKDTRMCSIGWKASHERYSNHIASLAAQVFSLAKLCEQKTKIASELINYVMGADDYDTNYKADDCIYIKHFKDLVLVNRSEFVAELEAQNKAMREALKHADEFISNGIEFGYIKMPDDDLKGIDSAHDTPEIIRAALALDKDKNGH